MFDVSQSVIARSSGIIQGSTDITPGMLDTLEATLETMGLGELLGLFMQSMLIHMTMWALNIIIFVLVYGRMLEIYMLTSLAPIPVATLSNREVGQMGQNYLKSLFALGLCGVHGFALLHAVQNRVYQQKYLWRTLERGVIMADTSALGQSVPKSQEGLFLMDGIEGLLSLPRHSVDMLLTDPPYGTTRNYWDVPLPLDALWEAVRWAVKPDGAALFFAQCPYDKVLGASNLAMLRYEWIWYKERGTGFLNANRAPLKKSENILVFYQKSPAYFPQFTYGEPYSKVHARKGSSPNYGKFERQGSASNDGRRYPGNVLFVQTVAHPAHPTQKPVELCEYLIKTYTRPGEVVADLCAGSGTTAVAALNTGRRFVCFESAPAIYGPAAQRIEQARLAVERGEKGE